MLVKRDTLSPTVTTGASFDTPVRTEDLTQQKMWDCLAHIHGLQAEIAALHLTMDSTGIATSPTLSDPSIQVSRACLACTSVTEVALCSSWCNSGVTMISSGRWSGCDKKIGAKRR